MGVLWILRTTVANSYYIALISTLLVFCWQLNTIDWQILLVVIIMVRVFFSSWDEIFLIN